MKCPYCEKEMISGLVSVIKAPIYFEADDAPRKFGIFTKKLKIQNTFDIGLKSQYCKDCNKIIMDLEENK